MVEQKFLFPNQEASFKMFQRPFGQPIPMGLCSLLSQPIGSTGTRHQYCFPSFKCHLSHWLIAILSAAVTTLGQTLLTSKISVSRHLIPMTLSSSWCPRMEHLPSAASLVAQMVTDLPATWDTWVPSRGHEDSLEKGMATYSSTLAWRIPWSEEPGRLQPMGFQRVGHNWDTKTCFHFQYWEK